MTKEQKLLMLLREQLAKLDSSENCNQQWVTISADLAKQALGDTSDLYLQISKFYFFSSTMRQLTPERINQARQLLNACIQQLELGLPEKKSFVERIRLKYATDVNLKLLGLITVVIALISTLIGFIKNFL